jgi:4-amino-4-deoxychorismate lyase
MNLPFHNQRVHATRMALFRAKDHWDLSRMIEIPDQDRQLIRRCRFSYTRAVTSVEFLPYTPRTIDRLYLVQANDLNYAYKYSDRNALERLKIKVDTIPGAEILIVKHGLVTDTSFSNIAFYDGHRWYTPSSPLLPGTKRAYYIQHNLITEWPIKTDDLSKYRYARLINAMLDLEESNNILINNILALP